MNHSFPGNRTIGRSVGARITAYAAFACSFAFASAVILGFLG